MGQELDLAQDGWRKVLSTWFDGRGVRHQWTIYRMGWPEEVQRYALRYTDVGLWGDDPILDDPGYRFAQDGWPERRCIEADPYVIRTTLARGMAAPIPIVAVHGVLGLDGYTRRVLWEASLQSSIDLKWWGDGPAEWHPFVQWTEELQDLLHATLFPESPIYDRRMRLD